MVHAYPPWAVFYEEGIVAKFMAFIYFLTIKAKDSILDHITFTFIHELMVEAYINQYNDPLAPMLKENMHRDMNTWTGLMIERLVKPVAFTNDLLKKGINVPQKRHWDLNENFGPQNGASQHFTPQ